MPSSTIELLLKVVAVLGGCIAVLEFFRWAERPSGGEARGGSEAD